MADTAPPEFLTTREVAALLRVKDRRVYDLAAAGEIPCRRATGKLLFPRAEIESWLAGRGAAAPAAAPARAAEVVAGSHDPLLDWALRESGCQLASFFDGSLDGIERLAAGEAAAAGLHIFEPEAEDWNRGHLTQRLAERAVVLIEWARRRWGLLVATGREAEIGGLAALAGRRVALRQATAGGRILFDHLLRQAGLGHDALHVLPEAARTEAEAAAAVASGAADAAPGIEAMARQYGLGFVGLVTERYDIALERRFYFEPRWQRVVGFTRSPAFRAKAESFGGYDLSGHGTVRWNGP